mmetsp:Transcript_30794/g.67601  ORF Transcript_30794/g.67601 Transcript_30794/m.67601 type:complete len:520 (-) Transcript_30794:19-1578(-)
MGSHRRSATGEAAALFITLCVLVAAATAASTSTSSSLQSAVISDIQSSITSCASSTRTAREESAVNDFTRSSSTNTTSNDGNAAYAFLRGLSRSPTFISDYWHRRPLLLRSSDIIATTANKDWITNAFTIDQHLRQIDGSYINGHCTAEILRNGTKTDTWEFRSLKDNPARQTTWAEVEDALRGGTVYFNTAGSLWPNLGALCRLTGYAFGLPTNVNVYVTPPGVTTSVPPHTDRQDVLCFQTAGAKRWRVYAPPARKKGVDPLHRGKSGDVLSFGSDLGEPLIDAVVRKGDLLYVPTGFPHTTDTVTDVDGNESEGVLFDEPSVHLTMGLDSCVWMLTFAHLRWCVLQRTGKEFGMEIETDDAYWSAMETIPIGFLAGDDWDLIVKRRKESGELDGEYVSRVMQALKENMIALEPNRWNVDGGMDSAEREDLPTDEDFAEVITYIVSEHALALLELQEEMFTDINPQRDDTIMKAYECTQKQNAIMERFGRFSKNEAMEQSFARSRMERDLLTKASQQ